MITYGAIATGLTWMFHNVFAPNPFKLSDPVGLFLHRRRNKAYERGRRIYEIFGREDNIRIYAAKGTHSYNDELRQAAVNWFKKTLKGEKEDFRTDINMHVEQDETLWCTMSGQVMEDFPDAKGIWEYNLEYFNRNRYKSAKDSAELEARVRKVLNMPNGKDKIYPRFISSQKSGAFERTLPRDSFELTDIFFFSEKGIAVAGTYIEKEGRECGKCTILLLENGTKDIYKEWDLIGKLLSDSDVFVFDARGTGAVESRAINPRDDYKGMYSTEYKLNYDAMMMKTSLIGLRVYDVPERVIFISEFYRREILMAGKGIGAIYALFAAFLAGTESIYLENMIPSYEKIVSTKFYEYDSRLVIHGILKEFDLPELITDMKRRDKTVTCFSYENI